MSKRKPVSQRLRATAYHEGGHAVLALWFRMGLRHVSIKPDAADGSLGRVKHRSWSKKFDPEFDDSTRTRDRVEKLFMQAVAGQVAEALYTGKKNYKGARDDFRAAYRLLEYRARSSEELDAYGKWLIERTKNLLRETPIWARVECVAAALLSEQELSGSRVREVIKAAIDKHTRKMLDAAGFPKDLKIQIVRVPASTPSNT